MKIEKHLPNKEHPTYKPKNPFQAKIISSENRVEEGSQDEVKHIVIDLLDSDVHILEGQSIGVIPPGEQENGKPHKVRLYSIASTRHGESNTLNHLALTVKRDVYNDGKVIHHGICSNYLCDLPVGSLLQCTGPVGRSFLLPLNATMPIIMIGVGTGIAPYRGFLEYLSKQGQSMENIWLYFGAKTDKELIYANQLNNDLLQYTDHQLNLTTARSRIDKTQDGQKLYVQHCFEKQIDQFWKIITNGEFVLYICGLKGMEEGIDKVLKKKAEEENKDWDQLKKQLRLNGQWNVEVY